MLKTDRMIRKGLTEGQNSRSAQTAPSVRQLPNLLCGGAKEINYIIMQLYIAMTTDDNEQRGALGPCTLNLAPDRGKLNFGRFLTP